MSKKILVLTSTFPRDVNSGSEPRFVWDLCLRLKENFNVCVLTQHRPGLARKENCDGIDIVRYRYAPERLELLSENGGISQSLKSSPALYLLLPFFILAQAFAIFRMVRASDPDIIHSHWIIPQGLCVRMALLFIPKKPKHVITAHGGDIYGFSGSLLTKLKCWVLKKTDLFCVVSGAMRDYCADRYALDRGKISVLPMGADLEETFKHTPHIQRKPGQLAFVGRLVEKKGLIHLLRSLRELVKTENSIHLKIAGSGPDKASLESEVSSLKLDQHVTFLGSIPHKEVATLYQESEIAVFPFVQAESGDMEGLGLVVLEAMGCMCPVIVGDVPAVYDTIKHNNTGLLVDPENIDILANTIYKLHTDPHLRNFLSSNGNQFAIENFSWKKCTERYNQVFTELLSSN